MLIHPDVDERIDSSAWTRRAADCHRAYLPPPRLRLREPTLGARQDPQTAVVESRGHCAQHFGAREHIADYRHAHPGCPAHGVHSAPVWAALAPPIHKAKLAVGARLVAGSAVDNASVAPASFSSSASAVNAR